MKTKMTKQQIKNEMAEGRKFFCYFTRNEQAIFDTRNPAGFGDYVAIVPKRLALNLEPISL